MVDRLFANKARLMKTLFHRVGDPVKILRPDGNAVENEYGKVADEDLTYVDQTYESSSYGSNEYGTFVVFAERIYGAYDSRPDEMGTLGGRVDVDSPRIAFASDVDVQEHDRVEFFEDGDTYYIEEKVPQKTHQEFRATLVTE